MLKIPIKMAVLEKGLIQELSKACMHQELQELGLYEICVASDSDQGFPWMFPSIEDSCLESGSVRESESGRLRYGIERFNTRHRTTLRFPHGALRLPSAFDERLQQDFQLSTVVSDAQDMTPRMQPGESR
jgi:hypothetical protein